MSYEQLKAFHQRHYHPSNAFFYTYGNLPLPDHLEAIETRVLHKFERIDPGTEVPSQKRWKQPRSVSYPYAFDKNEDPAKKSQACVAWLTADIQDTFEVLSLTLLEQILLGNSASPLRKALIDSGLGSSLSDGSGYDSDNRDTLFACGLKDVESSAAGKIEATVFGVLKELAANGIDKELIESAIHQIEFNRKEITNTPYPYGLKLVLTFSGSWFHGGDPLQVLNFDADLERLRRELAAGAFFEKEIQKYFLDNPHRVLLTLVPDQKLEQKQQQRTRAELDGIGKKMMPSEIAKLKEDARALQRLQETVEDVSCLPTLQREDIPPSVPDVKQSAADDARRITVYNQATSGIFYFSAAAGTGLLARKLLPLTPFFCYALPQMGTRQRDYVEMARRVDLYTGGVGLSSHARTRFDTAGDCLPFVSFNAKCLFRNQQHMFDIIREMLHEYDFSDLERLKNLLLEYRAGMESAVIHNGHRLAISLASRNFSATRALSETWSGVHQLRAVKVISEALDDEKLAVISRDLGTIGKTLFTQKNFQIALIGENAVLAEAEAAAASLREGFSPGRDQGFHAPDIIVENAVIREGWSTSSAVSFVALAFETVRMQHGDAAALAVISKLLRSLYLHREIREKGGAYGGFALYNPEDGLFSFASYRDPRLVATLDVFAAAARFIRKGSFSDDDVNEAILQVCSEIDKPDPPGPAARKAFYRKIISLSDDMRKQFKTRLLNLTRQQVMQAAEKYFNDNEIHQAVAVISGEEKLKAANKKLGNRALELHRI